MCCIGLSVAAPQPDQMEAWQSSLNQAVFSSSVDELMHVTVVSLFTVHRSAADILVGFVWGFVFDAQKSHVQAAAGFLFLELLMAVVCP